MNTLFLVPGEVGGTETYLRQTLLAMVEHCPEVSLVLFTNRQNDPVLRKEFARFDKVTFVLLDFDASHRPTRIFREQFELPGKVRDSGVDVLWSMGNIAPFFSPCPQVVTIHDMRYKPYPQGLTFSGRLSIDLRIQSSVRRCRRVITVSHFSKDEIVKYTGVSPDRVRVVYEAANPAFAEVMPSEKRKQLLSTLIPADRPYLFSIANTYPHKNIHGLVNAFGSLVDTIPHNLVMIGHPRLGEEKVQEAIQSIKDRSRVIRLQGVHMEKLVALYQGCDAFVLPSLYEGFGLPVLEAMMAGAPVITTRKAALPEVGGDGVIYFNPDERGELAARIQDVLGMAPKDRTTLLNRAREISRGFYWKWTAQRSLDVLRNAVE